MRVNVFPYDLPTTYRLATIHSRQTTNKRTNGRTDGRQPCQ